MRFDGGSVQGRGGAPEEAHGLLPERFGFDGASLPPARGTHLPQDFGFQKRVFALSGESECRVVTLVGVVVAFPLSVEDAEELQGIRLPQ